MSKRHRHAHPCPSATKTAFPDRAAAEEALEAIRAEYHRAPVADKIPRTAYRCPCGKWHLTSRAKPIDDARAEGARKIATASAAIRTIAAAPHE